MIIKSLVAKFVKYLFIFYNLVKYSFICTIYYVTTIFKNPSKSRLNPPKCLMDVQYGSHGYLAVKGVKIHYVEAGDKTKPLLLFIHGFPEFWYSWRYQLKEFSKDYWCVAIDMRGYGYSDKPEGLSNYSIKTIVAEIKEFVVLLGRDRFTIVGHDWGSLITGYFVDCYGDMLDGFILMSASTLDIHVHMTSTEYEQFRKSKYVNFFAVPFLPEYTIKMYDYALFDITMGKNHPKNVTKDDIEAYKYIFSKPGALTYPLNYYRQEVYNPTFEGEINVPIKDDVRGLFILGEKDPYISAGCIPVLKQKYKNFKVELLKNRYHFIQQENPDEVNKLIRDFLNNK